jgi:hypothetical protein
MIGMVITTVVVQDGVLDGTKQMLIHQDGKIKLVTNESY